MKRTLNRSLKFKVKTSEERREVALNRLSDYKPGKEMTNRQIQRVLGYRTPQAITLSIKAGSLTGKTPEAVEEFIRTYTPKRGSWIKPNAKSE